MPDILVQLFGLATIASAIRAFVPLYLATLGGVFNERSGVVNIGIDDRMKLDYIRNYGFTGIVIALLGRNSGLGIVAAALLFSFLDRASSGIGLNTEVPKEVTGIMQGVIILTIVIAYELVRRMTARRQLREQHERA